MKLYFLLFSFLPCVAMDPELPKPFKVNSQQEPTMEHFKVARRCNVYSEIVRRKEKLYLRVKLYYRNMKIIQNEYELDLDKLSKL